MAASRATTGMLGTFSFGSPLTEVLEVKSIKPAFLSVPEVSTTHLKSPNKTEEFIPGLIKPGVITITGNFIGDATQLAILVSAEAENLTNWQITGSVDKGTKTYTASGLGYVAKYENGPFEPNKAIEFTMDFQISGTITEAVA